MSQATPFAQFCLGLAPHHKCLITTLPGGVLRNHSKEGEKLQRGTKSEPQQVRNISFTFVFDVSFLWLLLQVTTNVVA